VAIRPLPFPPFFPPPVEWGSGDGFFPPGSSKKALFPTLPTGRLLPYSLSPPSPPVWKGNFPFFSSHNQLCCELSLHLLSGFRIAPPTLSFLVDREKPCRASFLVSPSRKTERSSPFFFLRPQCFNSVSPPLSPPFFLRSGGFSPVFFYSLRLDSPSFTRSTPATGSFSPFSFFLFLCCCRGLVRKPFAGCSFLRSYCTALPPFFLPLVIRWWRRKIRLIWKVSCCSTEGSFPLLEVAPFSPGPSLR